MVWGYRYIDINEEGCVVGAKAVPTEHSIDTEGMVVPEQPTDAIYSLYYNEEQGLYWVKVGEFEPDTPDEPTGNTATWDSMAQAISEGVNEV